MNLNLELSISSLNNKPFFNLFIFVIYEVIIPQTLTVNFFQKEHAEVVPWSQTVSKL